MQNSTDETRGEPLTVRARKRKEELERALDAVPADQVRARGDIELAISSIESLMTGDLEHMNGATAADLNRVLELHKHVAIVPQADAPDDAAATSEASDTP